AVKTSSDGVPMMRSMVLEFPEDLATHTLDRQYMLGENLLVAPIFNDRGEVDFYVPNGRWTNYLTNEVLEGGRWYHQVHDYMSLPLLVRPNSILIEGYTDDKAEYDYAENVAIHVFEIEDGKSIFENICDTQGQEVATITVTRDQDTLEVQTSGLNEYRIVLHNVASVSEAAGGEIEETAQGTVVSTTQKTITIKR